jgi:hypothetical protein
MKTFDLLCVNFTAVAFLAVIFPFAVAQTFPPENQPCQVLGDPLPDGVSIFCVNATDCGGVGNPHVCILDFLLMPLFRFEISESFSSVLSSF